MINAFSELATSNVLYIFSSSFRDRHKEIIVNWNSASTGSQNKAAYIKVTTPNGGNLIRGSTEAHNRDCK